jgi:3-oxoacyl-[acyl-carrier-protein] synthase II
MGEGAGVLVIERAEHARARGAKTYGRVAGYGASNDAYHITQPDVDGRGALLAMRNAIRDAGAQPTDIGHVNAHGTSTPLNDAAEAAAITEVFGERAVPVTSTKGVTGHALGAAGALEAVAMLLSMENRLIPPTAGTTTVDPEFTIDLVTGRARPWTPGPSISNSLGFGGHNGSIILAPV